MESVSARIISASLHLIDASKEKATPISIPNSDNDLESYLTGLLNEIHLKREKRQYEFLRETTEFYKALQSLGGKDKHDLNRNELAAGLSDRLVQVERDTNDRYGQMRPDADSFVKKGSFLQFLYREGGVLYYLGVKIDYSEFLDEIDFQKKLGLAISKKLYRACKLCFDTDGVPQADIYCYDTHSTPSVYWWKSFLELREIRNDSYNTRTAVKAVVGVVNGIKKKSPHDFIKLKNAVLVSFKQNAEMDYEQFVHDVFTLYEADDARFQDKHPRLIDKLRQLPEKKNFDTTFSIVPSEVKYRKSQVKLSEEIDITYKDDIQNIDEKIWSEQSASGEKLVVIKSELGFDKFKLKVRG